MRDNSFWHDVFAWHRNSVDLLRNLLDRRETDVNNQNRLGPNRWNIKKKQSVPCFTEHNYWPYGFSRTIQTVTMYGKTRSGEFVARIVFQKKWLKKSYFRLVRFCSGKRSSPIKKCFLPERNTGRKLVIRKQISQERHIHIPYLSTDQDLEIFSF